MTKREIRSFINEVSPSPGFILNLTKAELSDLVYEVSELELEEYSQNGTSNAKRLATLLESVNKEIADAIVSALITKKEYNES